MTIEEARYETANDLAKLMVELWPECNLIEEQTNCHRILQVKNETCFLAIEETRYIGFVHLALRSEYVEGTDTSPVGYVEGIYVTPDYRNAGIGKQLIRAGEVWIKEMGCTQLASDTSIDNISSIEFHKQLGFKEVARIACFIKEV